MRWLVPLVVIVLGIAAIFAPSPDAPQPGIAPGASEPPVAICVTDEGSERSTDLAITSNVAGSGIVTIFSAGTQIGAGGYDTGASGSTSVPVDEIAAVGQASALVEFPDSRSAAAAVTTGAASLSTEVCSRIPDRQVIVGGAGTTEGRTMELQLMNPYASEAVADITAFSESGRETAEAFNGVVIPPRSTVALDVGQILPGRAQLTLVVDATRGSVVAAANATVGGEAAAWRPVAPEVSWLLPLPVYNGTREIVIASPTDSEVAYQVDVFGPFGFEETAIEGVMTGSQETINLDSISQAATAVRVVAASPVGVFGRFSADGSFGLATASRSAAADWLLPGAGSIGVSMLAIVNVGLEAADVTVSELRESSRSRVFTLEPNEVREVALDEMSSDGVSVSSDGSIVPLYMISQGAAVAVSGGYPLADG